MLHIHWSALLAALLALGVAVVKTAQFYAAAGIVPCGGRPDLVRFEQLANWSAGALLFAACLLLLGVVLSTLHQRASRPSPAGRRAQPVRRSS